ncbi:DNA topoisomerase 2-associated protein pat1 [Colletotrichum spinosum]|uniref:DNA topoisomerase 2-associated protein pat1 n=1 Tax=Colletotrichum spinosum TaxID=1347390 RepID=A0A4R8PZG6_9PEZI|nr:DNA topoisomerase 2-associated protein pat1 [Colletotrichum spinosum]
MSFFGFDPSRGGGGGGHNKAAPGFSQAHDPFAGLSRDNNDEDDAVDFDDTYDGLGDHLDESGDAFNDDTFGGGGETISSAPVGKDFDFFGQTAKVSDAIEEEQVRYSRQVPTAKAAPAPAPAPAPVQHHVPQPQTSQPYYYHAGQAAPRPVRTGYEKYKDAEPIPDLHVDASLWGMPSKKSAAPEPFPQPQAAPASVGRKVMSLEEVEKAMREQATKRTPQPAPSESVPSAHGFPTSDFAYGRPEPVQQPSYHSLEQQQQQQRGGQVAQHPSQGHPVTILQRPQSISSKPTPPIHTPSPLAQPPHSQVPPTQPTQILQNPHRLSGDAAHLGSPGPHPHVQHQPHGHHAHRSQASLGRVPQVAPQHLSHLSEDEKAAYLDQETKRAKRNHKIWLLSKDNGLMTPQDKNFVTRIQLQQLVSATGNPIDHNSNDTIVEDFYYQVLSQIRGGQRQNPNQPLNNFAQTYLFQTGSCQGNMRRQGRAAENHVQRMEQQVQRAVEAAKNKPKNPQLVIAGSLGKISFSNAKTPKPLLNIKRTDSSNDAQRAGNGKRAHGDTNTWDRKAILRNIENVYNTVMKMEDHARHIPPPPNNGNDEEFHVKHQEWLEVAQSLNNKLWADLKVHEPIGATAVHPFIAFLSFPKGKKAIPRVFRHISFEQRTTILTMIVLHLDQLDVIRGAVMTDGEVNLNAAMRESIELFSAAVMPSLFAYFNETELDIVTGVLGLLTKLNIDLIARTRVGCSMLTLILSRAELLKQGGGGTPQLWSDWEQTFNMFFNILEPTLHHIFPGSVNTGEDVVVWQLLAAVGVSANPEQQQRLVLAVKDRVLDTVSHAKTLPGAMATTRLATVNLFMHSIGLDVDLLQ